MTAPTTERARPSARDLASYLVALRPILAGATDARRLWVRRIGVVMADARQGDPLQAANAAGQMGRDSLTTFRDCRLRVERLKPPHGCAECQRALTHWLDKLIGACELLVTAGRNGQLRSIQEAQELLAESRFYAQRFNAEYARLLVQLRQRVAAAGARPRPRGQVGRAVERSAV
jgi:hypothetical protein